MAGRRVWCALEQNPRAYRGDQRPGKQWADPLGECQSRRGGAPRHQPRGVDNTLDDAFGQRVASKVFTDLNQYYVLLEVEPKFRQGPDALSSIYLRSNTGQAVPLSEIATVSTTTGPLVVNHQGQFPSVTVSFNLANGMAIGTAVTKVTAAIKAMHMPASIQGRFQGTAAAYEFGTLWPAGVDFCRADRGLSRARHVL